MMSCAIAPRPGLPIPTLPIWLQGEGVQVLDVRKKDSQRQLLERVWSQGGEADNAPLLARVATRLEQCVGCGCGLFKVWMGAGFVFEACPGPVW